MQRRLYPYVYCVVVALLGLVMAGVPARAQSPSATTEQQQATAFTYAAPALSFVPPAPPSRLVLVQRSQGAESQEPQRKSRRC